jgi:hypothetical protein
MGSEESRGLDVRLEPYWLNEMGWTLNFAGAEAGLVAEWSLADGGGTLLLPTDDLVPGFFCNFFLKRLCRASWGPKETVAGADTRGGEA